MPKFKTKVCPYDMRVDGSIGVGEIFSDVNYYFVRVVTIEGKERVYQVLKRSDYTLEELSRGESLVRYLSRKARCVAVRGIAISGGKRRARRWFNYSASDGSPVPLSWKWQRLFNKLPVLE